MLDLKSYLKKSLSYSQYQQLISKLIIKGKTTGDDQTISRINFTKLNLDRMKRLDKTFTLSDSIIKKLNKAKSYTWLVIAEAWCGDCAQIIPILNKLSLESNGKINLHICLRDENPELMSSFLTNNTRSVPKLLVMDPVNNEVLETWGPRPEPAAKIAAHWKENSILIPWNDFERELHLWYAKDKGITTLKEIAELIK